MSTPQALAPEETPNPALGVDPPVDDKAAENCDAETKASSSGGDSVDDAPSTPAKEEVSAPPSTPSQPPPFVYDPNKITLKFIFANRDGVNVVVECTPSDTVGEVKGALLSMWPKEMPECSGGDKIRLICMGKGMLSPDSKTLQSFDIPVFKTHPTPVNVAVRPENIDMPGKKGSPKKSSAGGASGGDGGSADGTGAGGPAPGSSGCSCVIL